MSNEIRRQLATGLFSVVAASGITSLAQAAELTVSVEPASAEGQIMIALYNSQADFRERAMAEQKQDASSSPVRFRFENLPAGDYAVAVFQDLDRNGKLDTNFIGIPKEPYGFSQEPKGLMGPPKWDQVKVAVPETGTQIQVRLAK